MAIIESTSRNASSKQTSADLLALAQLTQETIHDLIDEQETNPDLKAKETEGGLLPSSRLYRAQRTINAITGKLGEMILEPSIRLIEFSCQYEESRALHICAEHRIADLLDEHTDSGVSVHDLGKKIGIDPLKLDRLLRCLTSAHIFTQVGPEVFANNRISAALVNNEPLRAYIMLYALDLFSAADHLPSNLADPITGSSYDVTQTAFQSAVGTTLPRWEWLEERLPLDFKELRGPGYPGKYVDARSEPNAFNHGTRSTVDDDPLSTIINALSTINSAVSVISNSASAIDDAAPLTKSAVSAATNGTTSAANNATPVANGVARKDAVTNGSFGEQKATRPRAELEVMGLAMLGGGRVFGAAHIFDYPWHELGNGTVVDVGGGVGGFCLQLSKVYPNLNVVVQDRADVVKHGRSIWEKERPDAVRQNKVRLMPHDFFAEQPVKGADVYWFRYIIHDWSDDYCIKILSSIARAMTHNSRLLIADQVMNTTVGCPEIASAPHPLPANYGYHTRYSHFRDMSVMAVINGIERTPEQFKFIVERSGLIVSKIWECRSQVSIVECHLARNN